MLAWWWAWLVVGGAGAIQPWGWFTSPSSKTSPAGGSWRPAAPPDRLPPQHLDKRGRGSFSDIFGIGQAVPPNHKTVSPFTNNLGTGSQAFSFSSRQPRLQPYQEGKKDSNLVWPPDFDSSEPQDLNANIVGELNVLDPDSPYGLIHNILGGGKKPRPGPRQGDDLGGLRSDEVWLSDGDLLVLTGGNTVDREGFDEAWPSLEEYDEPGLDDSDSSEEVVVKPNNIFNSFDSRKISVVPAPREIAQKWNIRNRDTSSKPSKERTDKQGPDTGPVVSFHFPSSNLKRQIAESAGLWDKRKTAGGRAKAKQAPAPSRAPGVYTKVSNRQPKQTFAFKSKNPAAPAANSVAGRDESVKYYRPTQPPYYTPVAPTVALAPQPKYQKFSKPIQIPIKIITTSANEFKPSPKFVPNIPVWTRQVSFHPYQEAALYNNGSGQLRAVGRPPDPGGRRVWGDNQSAIASLESIANVVTGSGPADPAAAEVANSNTIQYAEAVPRSVSGGWGSSSSSNIVNSHQQQQQGGGLVFVTEDRLKPNSTGRYAPSFSTYKTYHRPAVSRRPYSEPAPPPAAATEPAAARFKFPSKQQFGVRFPTTSGPFRHSQPDTNGISNSRLPRRVQQQQQQQARQAGRLLSVPVPKSLGLFVEPLLQPFFDHLRLR